MKRIHIIMDYGHGKNCPGKHSPDMSFFEWHFNRLIGRSVARMLRQLGFAVHEIWTEDHEPLSDPGKICTTAELRNALNWRWQEVNRLCSIYGTANCICISIHANAADISGWHDARGFMSIVGSKASTSSKRLAKYIYDEAERAGLKGNRAVPSSRYWSQSLAMCDRTSCPAVLTEAGFYDNKEDLAMLKSKEWQEKIIQAHVQGILKYIAS